MIDPIRDQQVREMEMVERCVNILTMSRNELYIHMRYLDISLSCLGFEADWNRNGAATDGFMIYYEPDYLIKLFAQGRKEVNRAYLHMVMHCLFGHMDGRKGRDAGLWHLACDMAVESIIDGLLKTCIRRPPSMFRREWYQRLLHQGVKVMNAERVYSKLVEMKLNERQLERLKAEFFVDGHDLWEEDKTNSQIIRRQNQWKDNREKMQTEMESGGRDRSGQDEEKKLLEQVQVENRERYDYKRFLRRFAVMKEEMQADDDSFDYIYYTYGLNKYGNMPLIEPLESKEVHRIEDFALVIDTSMSCSGELTRRFLEETYSVLGESESYFRKINVHIIQCDDQVRSDVVIRNREQMEDYMKHFAVTGGGGTDFRPAFEYVDSLRKQGQFTKLRGLLYFTDGKGIYPVKMPPYDTAFVFVQDQYEDVSVPPWAIKLILEPEHWSDEGGEEA